MPFVFVTLSMLSLRREAKFDVDGVQNVDGVHAVDGMHKPRGCEPLSVTFWKWEPTNIKYIELDLFLSCIKRCITTYPE
jgi:hypothetical protein